jgi:hypothetical protein
VRLKIKWNDDRVSGALTAILLIGRDRLFRGDTENLIQASLADYREDPERYKMNKATWAVARELGPLTNPQQVAFYRSLTSAVDALVEKMARGKRQFNSLLELDNFLIANLQGSR